MLDLLALKAVIRCRDHAASRSFYTGVLGLTVVEEWDQEEGVGCIVAFGEHARGGSLELAGLPGQGGTGDGTCASPVANDKIELQIRTDSVDRWAEALRDRWPFRGPVDRPWGQRYLWLRDPDGVQVVLVEGSA